MERKEEKKEARAEKLDKMRAYLNLTSDQESRMSNAIQSFRTGAKSVKENKNLSAEQLGKFQAAQGELSSALGRLMVVVEQYPQLKANQNFLELQSQLEGTENRITVERQKFNEVVQEYNKYVRSFPQTMLAGMYGFKEKAYFASDKGAEKAPKVEF